MRATTGKIICDAGRAMLDFPEGQRGNLAQHVGSAYEVWACNARRRHGSTSPKMTEQALARVLAELHALGFKW